MLTLFRRLRYLLQRDRLTRDLEEEMRIHVEMRAARIRDNTNESAAALQSARTAKDDAIHIARRRFGNSTVQCERSRDAWGFGGFEDFSSDIRFAVRRLVHRPGFAIGVIAVMSIGIGGVTAMFSAIDAALLRPLPFAKPEQLMILPIKAPVGASTSKPGAIDFTAIRSMQDIFSHVAAYSVGGLNLSDSDRPSRLRVGVVTSDFFATMGTLPAIGRTFAPEEGVPGGNDVAVLSDGLWRSAFGSRSIADFKITLNGKRFEVIGVMPPGFSFPENSDVWIPMTVPLTMATFEAFRDYVRQTTIARVADGVTTSEAALKLLARFESSPVPFYRHKADNDGWLARMRAQGGVGTPMQTLLSGERSFALYVLLGATTLLLLIACANVTNLLLAQASVRRREIAVRQLLGATRLRIVRQLLTESTLLSMAAALLGVIIAMSTFQALRLLMPPGLLGLIDLKIDLRMLAFTATLAIAAAMVFGLWPAIGSSRRDSSETIKNGGGHGTTVRGSGRLRRVLVATELALTVVLLVGAGVMLRSFEKIVNRNVGVETTNVGTMEIALPASAKIPERSRKLNAIANKLASLPGIEAAGVSKTLPLATAGQLYVGITMPGSKAPANGEFSSNGVTFEDATGGYFKALGIRLIEGRLFDDAEDTDPSRVAIISEFTAKQFWPGTSPIGRAFIASEKDTLTVVGVVADVPRKLDEEVRGHIYIPLGSDVPFIATIVARSASAMPNLLRQMTQAVQSVDPAQPVFSLRLMEDVRNDVIAPRRVSTAFLTLFALLALTLASVGVYAVVAYGLAQRERELGIRSALGASAGSLLSLLSREMIWVSGAGVVIGLAAAWGATRVLERLAYGVNVREPLLLLAVAVILLGVTMLATIVPSRRVFRLNPSDVMRAD